MNLRVLPSTVIILLIVVISCKKDSSDSGGGTQMSPLEKRADSLKKYVLHQHFIPVDFYASKPIDYNQDDSVITLSTNLQPFILPYLKDDSIVFEDNNRLHVNQGDSVYQRPIGERQLDPEFDSLWEVGTIKATNEVYLKYLTYTYYQTRYTVDSFKDDIMVAHVPWVSKIDSNDKALLYTRFEKK